ncbi:MAG: DUF2783 domain-containing protein [Gammaproteobacteria bacterium]|nr:DUF2783 domain-containing protein [Gammaproteobacteria bacterium]
MSALETTTFEALYDALAAAIDRVGPARETDFLARLALLLMHAEVDEAAIRAALAAAEASVSDAS